MAKKLRHVKPTRCQTLSGPVQVAFVVSLLVSLLVAITSGCSRSDQPPTITVACAAVMRGPMEEIAREYQSQHRIEIEIRFGGSNTLLTQLKIAGASDVYIAADAAYTLQAFDEGLIEQSCSIATVRPVIVKRKDSAIELTKLEDLASPELRIALANPRTAAVGRNTKMVLQSVGLWESIASNVQENGVMFANVNEVAGAVAVGSVDAGVVWDSVATTYQDLRVIEDNRWGGGKGTIEIAVVKGCRNPENARSLIDFFVSDPASSKILRENGFQTLR